MALICGIYLLGLFRTDHDYEEIKVGPGRIVIRLGLPDFLALFLTPALFGRPPENKIWYSIAGLLPADAVGASRPRSAAAGLAAGEALAQGGDLVRPKAGRAAADLGPRGRLGDELRRGAGEGQVATGSRS